MNTAALISAACDVRKNAYAPYSNYLVGAALLTSSGKVYCGCNVENKSYSLTICAERAALCHAIQAGERDFEALAVATGDGATPCGACRQAFAEFSPHLSILIVTVGPPPKTRETELHRLLPEQF